MAVITTHVDIKGTGEVQRMLDELRRALGKRVNVTGIVGYRAKHATYVHEIGPPNRTYRNGKRHKYLESVTREFKSEIVQIVGEGIRKREDRVRTMHDAVRFVKEKSQEIVPYDTGELHDSAYTEVI